MGLIAAVSAARSLLDLAKELAVLIKRALGTADLRQRVLLYLEAAHGAVWGLGMERQQILTDARRCEVQNTNQVEALWKRMDTYLHEDHIRPQLQDAIDGLRGRNASIAAQAQELSWRKRDKQAAVETFTRTLSELEPLLQGLTSNFYPFGSGMGVQTLVPIYKLLTRLRDDHRRETTMDYDAEEEELGDLILQALQDKSHYEWVQFGGQVEQLIAELQLAFR